MVIDRINGNLSALFNIEDPVYKSLICDKDATAIDGSLTTFGTAVFGTAVFSTLKPVGINIGAIASQIEYLRQAGIYFLKQMYIDQASDDFLKYQLETFFSSYQLDEETDEEWIQRTFTNVFQQKVSNASIKNAIYPYSSQMPKIYNVIAESAYADYSFADCYLSGEIEFEGDTIIVLPAIAETDTSSSFTIRIVMYDTLSEDIYTVVDILNKIIAAGIYYILEIQYT